MATPCWPAPVSAITRVLPIRSVSRRLADRVVDLVGAGVIEVFTLEPDLGTADRFGQSPGVVQRAGATDKGLQQALEFSLEFRVFSRSVVFVGQLIECRVSVSGTNRPPKSPKRPR